MKTFRILITEPEYVKYEYEVEAENKTEAKELMETYNERCKFIGRTDKGWTMDNEEKLIFDEDIKEV